MSRRAPAATRTSPAWLAPKVLIPAVLVLAVVALGFGVAYAVKDGNRVFNWETCEAGTEGCELRAPTHLHADLALFIDGERFDFGREEFLSTAENPLDPTVHLHDPRHSVVHVHRTNTTWDMFFSSIGFRLTDPSFAGVTPETTTLELSDGRVLRAEDGKSFKFLVNRVHVDGIAGENIGDLDRVLISYGTETPEQVLETQWPLVSDEACIASGRCLDRVPADEPPEPCGAFSTECTG